MKLLIAEDDMTTRTMLMAVTKKWGYEIIAVDNGFKAREVLQQPVAPSLLLIDWDMPEMNGLELCRLIRKNFAENPPYIILLSAHKETGDIVEGLHAGANDYIAKPFDNSELQARLQVGGRMLDLQQELTHMQETLTHERQVIEDIILKMRASKPFINHKLRFLDKPVEKTSGDILLSAVKPDGTHHIMLGDFTGHGLMAAIGGPVVNDIFHSMTAKGLDMVEIATEINRQLIVKLPTSLFMGSIFFEMNPHRTATKVWNCGMSDVLVFQQTNYERNIPSQRVALGIVEQEFSNAELIKLTSEHKIYAYSDGITEAINMSQKEYGQERLIQSVCEMIKNDAPIDFLTDQVAQFCDYMEQLDDMTLVEISG